jgi:immune inhibitor A
LWKEGTGGSEYFLIENRQRTGYDADLPGGGLLVWHIDDAQPDNTNEDHYKVGLVQADGHRDLELNHNRGDAGDQGRPS